MPETNEKIRPALAEDSKPEEDNLEKKEPKEKNSFGLSVEDMAEAGLHLGHRTSRINPKMFPYIYGSRNTVHIIDLEKTLEKFTDALKFISSLVKEGKTILFVGTKIQVKEHLKKTALECSMPYVSERWLGGTFTNFGTIRKRIEYFKELERQKEQGELQKYTKWEQGRINQELADLEVKIGGIKDMEKLPDAVFVLDMKKDELAMKEARMKGVPIVGIADTNVDLTLADYPIPANDDAISSVKYILGKVKEVVLKAKAKDQTPKENIEASI